VSWPRSLLEVSERLEQLRAMHHGVRIIMDEAVQRVPAGVDTPEDLEAVRRFLTDSELP
jgi:3-deoxy-manno-octulosonate cytidylyltransferase (CMP-KDO synthetase)